MTAIIIVALVVYGLVLGSFVNALVWRFHEQEELRAKIDALEAKMAKASSGKLLKSERQRQEKLQAELQQRRMSKGRSMCSKCHHPLAAKDLIPLFSWLWLRGRCRYCRQPIADSPLIEVLTPLLFVVSYLVWPLHGATSGYPLLAFFFWLVLLVGFVALIAYDIRWYILPDRIVWPLAAIATVQVVLHATLYHGGWPVIATAVWGVLIDSGFFWLLYQVSKGSWIGGGDVKLGVALGLLVGGPLHALLVIFLASLLGTCASVPLMLQRKLKRTSVIPFGPFLIVAAIIIVLCGERIDNWLFWLA